MFPERKRKADKEKQLLSEDDKVSEILVATMAETDEGIPTYASVGEQNKAFTDTDEPQTAF